jgi:hypothetical protein
MTMTATIRNQIRSVEREITMRERNYPKWVQAGRMSGAVADAEINTMKEVLATLKRVAAREGML